MFVSLHRWIMKRKKGVLRLFLIVNLLLTLGLVIGSLDYLNEWGLIDMKYSTIARWFGKASLISYCLTLLPGIFRRMKVQSPLIWILMQFRRQLGIFMYITAMIHYAFFGGLRNLTEGFDGWPSKLRLVGLVAVGLGLLLFVTSNDFSVKLLKDWWVKLQKLTYVIMFMVLLHVGWADWGSVWTILAGITTGLLLLSWVVSWRRG